MFCNKKEQFPFLGSKSSFFLFLDPRTVEYGFACQERVDSGFYRRIWSGILFSKMRICTSYCKCETLKAGLAPKNPTQKNQTWKKPPEMIFFFLPFFHCLPAGIMNIFCAGVWADDLQVRPWRGQEPHAAHGQCPR